MGYYVVSPHFLRRLELTGRYAVLSFTGMVLGYREEIERIQYISDCPLVLQASMISRKDCPYLYFYRPYSILLWQSYPFTMLGFVQLSHLVDLPTALALPGFSRALASPSSTSTSIWTQRLLILQSMRTLDSHLRNTINLYTIVFLVL